MQLIIRRSGTMIDLSPDGYSPLPPEIINLLLPHLRYQYKKILRGADAIDPVTGERHGVQIENRYLYSMEEGRLVTGYGFIPLFGQVLTQAGHDVRLADISPPRERPDCFTPDWGTVQRTFQFRPRQEECLRAIDNAVQHRGGGVIKAPPGFGKTELFNMLALLYPRANIHIVVRPKDVAARIVQRMLRYVPLVGQVGGGKRRMGRVTVFTGDSLHLSDCDADLLLPDEAHMLMADTYAAEMSRYRISLNIAFSATPYTRMDGTSARMQMFFGPTLFSMTYQEAVELGLTVPIRVRWIDVSLDYDPSAGKTGVPETRWGIWRNQERNRLIAQDVRENYTDAATQILILCQTFEHAVHLWQHLPEFELCYSQQEEDDIMGYIRSGLLPPNFVRMTPQRRDAMREAFEAHTLKRVICTDVWSTGVDFEQLQVLYRADGRESEDLATQAGGRPSRIYEGKPYGEIVDCFDRFNKKFRRKSETRRRYYRANGWLDNNWPVGRGRRQISHA